MLFFCASQELVFLILQDVFTDQMVRFSSSTFLVDTVERYDWWQCWHLIFLCRIWMDAVAFGFALCSVGSAQHGACYFYPNFIWQVNNLVLGCRFLEGGDGKCTVVFFRGKVQKVKALVIFLFVYLIFFNMPYSRGWSPTIIFRSTSYWGQPEYWETCLWALGASVPFLYLKEQAVSISLFQLTHRGNHFFYSVRKS